MPVVQVIDTRQEFLETRKQATFSRALIEAVTGAAWRRGQSMLLLNRADFRVHDCALVASVWKCPNCSVTLHVSPARPAHVCATTAIFSSRVPERCPKCDSDHIQFLAAVRTRRR